MLSRIADSLYWMNRYMERVDGILRMIKTSYILSFDNIQVGFPTWAPSLKIFTRLPPDRLNGLMNDNVGAIQYLLVDVTNVNSLKVLIGRARENARGTQDHITREVWEHINQLYHLINQADLPEILAGPRALTMIETLMTNRELYSGVTDSTMSRGEGWSFMNVGKHTERCLLTVDFTHFFYDNIGFDLDNDQDILYWRSLLLALSGYEMHLKSYRNQRYNHNVADQVLFSSNFPRSLSYALERTGKYLEDIAASNPVEGSTQLLRVFRRISSAVKFAEMAMVEKEGLRSYLDSMRQQLNTFAQLFARTYFAY